MNDSMHGTEAAQAMAGLRLDDLSLAADMREELAASPDHMETPSTDSLSVVKLGMQLRCALLACRTTTLVYCLLQLVALH